MLGATALAVAALALAAWQGTLVQSATAAHWSLLAVIAVALVVAVVTGRRRQREASSDWLRRRTGDALRDLVRTDRAVPIATVAGAAIWVVLVAATIGWDLNSFVHQAPDLPTLSRLVGAVTRHDWGRALVFALWLALGAYLAVGGRRRVAADAGGGREAGVGTDEEAVPGG